jgi:two-component system uhpT operon response regulator UhpA
LALLLRDSGYEVHEAGNGSDGLGLIDEAVPSVAVVDVGLPDVSGLDITRKVRQKYGRQQVHTGLIEKQEGCLAASRS